MKKFLALLLALIMVLSLAACVNEPDPTTAPTTAPTKGNDPTTAPTQGNDPTTAPTDPTPVVYVDPFADLADDYDAQSAAIYDAVLGEFLSLYEAAKEVENQSERFALMAIAEAKLLETGIMLPLTANGGNYAISRAVPNTVTSTLWGNDSYRYHNVLVATEPLTAEHRATLKGMWADLRGTGTWEAEAKKFMADHGYTLKDSYSIGYSSDPQTWDVLATSQAADSEAIVNTYDGLFEYNSENELMPALAESYTMSPDGLTYTFKIRQGLKWVDSQGREVADVVADDFVAGMQHMLDAMGGLEYLVQGVIVNVNEYIAGDVTDFAEVGVKALDDYTLEYTLVQPTSYFMTMLGYGVFAPMSRSYFISQGGGFGADYNASADSYTYGKTPDNIAYCGPYLVTNATEQNTIVFQANPSYWNAENINLKTITWLYNDGEDPTKAYNDCKSGVLDGAGLNASALEAAKKDGMFETYAYVSATDATAFPAFVNLNRNAFVNFNDGTSAPTPKDQDMIDRTRAAMYNQHFRLALTLGLDRGTYNAAVVGEELKLTSLVNSYTPGDFVYLFEDVTVDINGTPTTFTAGTYYGAIMQAQIDADGYTMKVWDPTAEEGVGASFGYDGWYNPEAAAAEIAIAIQELGAQGIEISAENPIYLDLPTFTGSQAYADRSNVYKQSIEKALGGAVIINIVDCVDSRTWYYAGYYTTYGNEGNYDICDVSGWGPDYGDPATYLDTFLPDYAGYMCKMLGLF